MFQPAYPMVRLYQDKPWGKSEGKAVESVAPEQVTIELVKALLDTAGPDSGIEYYFKNRDMLCLMTSHTDHYRLSSFKHLTLCYGEYMGSISDDEHSWSAIGNQYFHPSYRDHAIEAFVARLKSVQACVYYQSNFAEKLDVIWIRQMLRLRYESHYDYLDAMLEPFWMLVFAASPAATNCAGIVTAHGDKGYSYRDEWQDAGIPFEHGMLLYLLTYTSERGETLKQQSHKWVIDNYARYLLRITLAEQTVLRNKYGLNAPRDLQLVNETPTIDSERQGLKHWAYLERGVQKGTIIAATELDAVKIYLHKHPKKFV